jgi:hypothetical protein
MRTTSKTVKKLVLSVVVGLFCSGLLAPGMVHAEAVAVDGGDCNPNSTLLGLPKWYKYLEIDTSNGGCSPSISETADALPIGIAVLEGMLRLGGLVAVVMIFIGGFKFITSQGNSESAAAARKTAINALIGLVIVMISTAVVSYIGSNIGV